MHAPPWLPHVPAEADSHVVPLQHPMHVAPQVAAASLGAGESDDAAASSPVAELASSEEASAVAAGSAPELLLQWTTPLASEATSSKRTIPGEVRLNMRS